MHVKDVLSCSFPNWYNVFKRNTINAVVLPIPENVVQYLCEDGSLVLPQGTYSDSKRRNSSDSESSIDWESVAKETPELDTPCFPEFDSEIKNGISKLGGNVFIKLDWSAPKDASWIAANNSLKCSNPGDIYLLLKSSDDIMEDLCKPFQHCEDSATRVNYSLVLKEWKDIHPACEFRCFVANNELIAITQRDCSSYFEHVTKSKSEIVDDIVRFYEKKVRGKFPLCDYVFDVVREHKDKIWLLDFGPFGKKTGALLFTWDELLDLKIGLEEDASATESSESSSDNSSASERRENNAESDHELISTSVELPRFRCIDEDMYVQPSMCKHHGVPQEVVNMCSQAHSGDYTVTDFLRMKIQEEN